MSELTRCNFCSMKIYQAREGAKGKKIYIEKSKFMGGSEVYSIPKAMANNTFSTMTEETKKIYWICWFMEIGSSCCC